MAVWLCRMAALGSALASGWGVRVGVGVGVGHGRANRYEFESSSVNICTLTPILPCDPLKFLYATLRIAKILEVEENRPLKMKQMPPKRNPK